LFQLGSNEFPPLKAGHRSNLPLPTTALVGRANELGEVMALLERDDVRLLTITGAGGTGKTRLAVEAAGDADADHGIEVWWIPLAAINNSQLVTDAIARCLGARSALADHIGERPMLLLLDNFEHVLDAAAGVSDLLACCPRLRILVTSREALRLRREHVYELNPLREAEAVALFAERASAYGEFAESDVVSEICRRLDCLPLAIELAAARVHTLPAPAILARLEQRLPVLAEGPRDAPNRQRTLHATIQWSHDLLAQDERQLFRRLAVFAGGCTLQAAELVCEADLDSLGSLVERSLVRRTGERYWMLETIREFAAEQLRDSGELDSLQTRHAEVTLELVRDGRPGRTDPPSREWLARFDAERANVRAAMTWAETHAEPTLLEDLVHAALPYWGLHSDLTEGPFWVDQLLNSARSWSPIHAELLNFASMAAYDQGDYSAARAAAERQLAGCRAAKDNVGTIGALNNVAVFSAMLGDHARALAVANESLQLAQALDDPRLVFLAREALVEVLIYHHEYGRVIDEADAALELAGTLNLPLALASILANKGNAQLALGQIEDAAALYQHALKIAEAADGITFVWYMLVSLAAVAAKADDLARAATLTGAADAIQATLGTTLEPYEAGLYAETAESTRVGLSDSAYEDSRAIGEAMGRESIVAYALAGFAADDA
jgi:predicted ATPase